MAQRNIDFGTFPNDPDADAIRTAFTKTQENFTELFAGLDQQGVLSVNKTSGDGISVFPITGNVVVSANIATVPVVTSTLAIGLSASSAVSSGAILAQSANQQLYIDLPANITGVTGANFSGTIIANTINANLSFNSSGTIGATGNITGGNITSNGSATVTGNVVAGNVYANSGTVRGSLLTGTLTTAAQPNITSVGTLTSLAVTGNITSGNANLGNLVSANFLQGDGYLLTNVSAAPGNSIVNGSSNVIIISPNGDVFISVAGTANVVQVTQTGANITGTLNATGNANVGNIGAGIGVFTGNVTATNVYANSGTIGASLLTGTLTTNAQPNITSVGTLTSLSVTGNVSAGNLVGPLANGNSNISLASNGNITLTATSNSTMVITDTGANITGTANVSGNANVGNIGATAGVFTGNVTAGNANVTGQLISTIATGTAPLVVTSTTQVANLNVATAGAATNAAAVQTNASTSTTVYPTFVSASTNANYALNTVSGISANLANNAITATTFVGSLSGAANSATNAEAVLSNSSTNTTVYLTGTSTSANGNVGLEKVTGIYANMGNNAITATTFVGALSGAATTAGTVTTAAQPNITSLGTLTSLAVTGNATAANFIGNLANGNSDISIPAANGNINFDVAGNANILVVTGTGANITGTMNATGNANVGNLGATGVVATTLGGSLTTASQPNITSVGTLASLSVTGKVDAGQLQGDGGNISNIQGGNVSGTVASATAATNAAAILSNSSTNTTVYLTGTSTSANGNVALEKVTGIYANMGNNAITATTFVGALSGAATTAGTVTTAAQPNITSVGTLSSLSVTGNLSSGNANLGNLATANFFQGDGSLLTNISVGAGSYILNGNSNVTVNANSNVTISSAGNANIVTVTGTGANIAGTANVTGNLSAGNVSATLFTGTIAIASNAQPNITSLGTLTSLEVNGVANLGAVGNVRISGGSNNQVLVATGTGSNVAFITATGLTTAPGTNTQVLFNDAGSFAANANMTFDKTTGTLSAHSLAITNSGTFGNVFANSGTIGASLLTGTLTTNAQPNITSVGSLTSLIVGGNINAGNVAGGNAVAANFFIGSGANLTSIAGGNVTGTVANATAANTLLTNTSTSTTVYPTFVTSSSNGYSQNYINSGISANLGNASITATTFVGALSGAATSATTAGTVTTNAQPNITSVGTLTGLTVNGNVGTGRLTVNPGTATSNVHALTVLQTWNNSSVQFSAIEANITDTASAANSLLFDLQVADVSKFAVSKEGNVFFSGVITGNANGLSSLQAANIIGTLPNAVTNNITNVGTITSGTWNSTFTAGLNANTLANIQGANVTGTVANSTTAGTVTTAAQPNITSVGTLTSLAVTGNTVSGNFIGVFANGNSNVSIPAANGNVNISAIGNANILIVTGTGANIAGTLNATGNANVGNLGTAQVLASANITAPQLISNIVTGTAPLVVTSTTQVANLNVATAGSAGTATTAGTVTTAAQPNITSTGTLTSLTVSGNITAQANVNMSGYVIRSVATAISAAGTAQGNATAITKEMNVVSTVASGAGVILPTAVAGMVISITNTSANSLAVYPATSAAINTGSANAAYSQPAGSTLQFIAPTTTQWYTVGATFA